MCNLGSSKPQAQISNIYINYKLGQIQVSFSLSLAGLKISWLSKTLLYLWVTKQNLAVLQGCGCSLWVLLTHSCTL